MKHAKHITISLLATLLLPVFVYAEDAPITSNKKQETQAISKDKEAKGVAKDKESKEETSLQEETTTQPQQENSFTLCSQRAIETRDTSIATSRTTYNAAMANALTERKNREKLAVAMVNESDKKDAIKTSVENYKHQAKSAQTTLSQARKLAWQTFEDDLKTCRDLETVTIQEQDQITSEQPQAKMMRKSDDTEQKEYKSQESKSFKDTLLNKLGSIKSLFE